MRSLRFSAGLTSIIAGALLAGGGCSGDVAPAKGQLMVVLQSDMAVPKDVSAAVVLITVQGRVVFNDTFFASAGQLQLPGTIAIVAGEKEAEQVKVEVVGLNRDGGARTFTKAVTTMPRSRMASLRMPIQWLCSGEVNTVSNKGDPVYASSCTPTSKGEERSCLAGSCEKVEVAEADLPAFNAPEVFGGGDYPGDPSGECFDVQGCFKLGAELTPDLDPTSDTYCQAALSVPAGAAVNFAIDTGPEGDGVCDDDDPEAPCFVVLDQSETFGWTSLTTDAEPTPGSSGVAAGGQTSSGMAGGKGGSTGVGGASSGDDGLAGRTGGGGAGPLPGGAGSGTGPLGGTSGSAGATGAGGAAPMGGSGAGGSPPSYITSGDWHGHVFTAVGPGSTINPQVLPNTDFPLCVSGQVAGTADSSSYALVGFNLNQAPASDPLATKPVNSTGGVDVLIDNLSDTLLRVQLNGPNAQDDPNEQWCAPLTPSGGLTPWDSFTNQCWLATGAEYAATQPITSVEIVVPGGTAPTPFDFCIEEINEATIAPKLRAPLQPQSVAPPGLRPLQAGGSDEIGGSMVVQLPTAVCDKLNADPTLRLTATAACEAKTEQTPVCGPWSSASAPQVPNPDLMVDPGPTGEGGAGGMGPDVGGSSSGGQGSGQAGGGGLATGGSSNVVPNDCKAAPHQNTSPMIASFDTDQPEAGIELLDGRQGFAFSVGYGTCQPTNLVKFQPGPNSARFLNFQATAPCSMVQGDAVTLLVPFLATGFADAENSVTPDSMCPYDATGYTGISFWAKSPVANNLQVALLMPSTVSVTDPVPGGTCVTNCRPRAVAVTLTSEWKQYQVLFAALETNPSQLLGIQFQSMAESENMFDIDQISFIGGQ
jgi:hypothetical protein